jgi:Holliday junction resolvase RusA-like endonuclease
MGSNTIEFSVVGVPVAKARPRATTINGAARLYTPSNTRDYEQQVAQAARGAMRKAPPLDRAVAVSLDIRLPVPASWSKTRRADALAGRVFVTSKPDTDNYAKAVLDGCNGALWVDDAQVVRLTAQKRYAETPGVDVLVTVLGGQ